MRNSLVRPAAALAVLVMVGVASAAPNFVFILADDLGYGDLGCFGQTRFETPHLDRLAERGLKLTQHYAGSTVCAPSRCALMTGLHTGHCLVRGNLADQPYGQFPLADEAVTVAELLKRAGYATGAFGKWGLGYTGTEGDPGRQGFDRFFGYKCQRAAHRYYPRFLWDNDRRVDFDTPTYSHDEIIERACGFIEANKDKPFLCYIPATIPHAALEVPEEWHDRYRQRFAEYESTVGRYAGAEVQNPVAAFAAMVAKLDHDVGRIVALLERLGIAENTLVVFTSDNGPHREGGHKPDLLGSAGPWRGYKRDMYEGGIRVPTIAYWPGVIDPGGETDHLSASWDWAPTFLDLAGAPPMEQTDGISLAPTLRGSGTQAFHEYLYWEFHERGGKQAIRAGDWKAVRLGVRDNPNGPVELYNLASDPEEALDVAGEFPDRATAMASLMDDARTPSETFRFVHKKVRTRHLRSAANGSSGSE